MNARRLPFESEFDVIGASDFIENVTEDEACQTNVPGRANRWEKCNRSATSFLMEQTRLICLPDHHEDAGQFALQRPSFGMVNVGFAGD